jgi:hypothetical protein
MNFILFNSKALIDIHIMARGATINANCTVIDLGKGKNLKMKSTVTEMMEANPFFPWDNMSAHTSTNVKNWLTTRATQVLSNPLLFN